MCTLYAYVFVRPGVNIANVKSRFKWNGLELNALKRKDNDVVLKLHR